MTWAEMARWLPALDGLHQLDFGQYSQNYLGAWTVHDVSHLLAPVDNSHSHTCSALWGLHDNHFS